MRHLSRTLWKVWNWSRHRPCHLSPRHTNLTRDHTQTIVQAISDPPASTVEDVLEVLKIMKTPPYMSPGKKPQNALLCLCCICHCCLLLARHPSLLSSACVLCAMAKQFLRLKIQSSFLAHAGSDEYLRGGVRFQVQFWENISWSKRNFWVARKILHERHFTRDTSSRTLHRKHFTKDISRETLHERHFTKDSSRKTLHDGHRTKDTSRETLYERHFTKDSSSKTLYERHFTRDTVREILHQGHFIKTLYEKHFIKDAWLEIPRVHETWWFGHVNDWKRREITLSSDFFFIIWAADIECVCWYDHSKLRKIDVWLSPDLLTAANLTLCVLCSYELSESRRTLVTMCLDFMIALVIELENTCW